MHCFVHLTISHSVLFVLVLNTANRQAKAREDNLKQRSSTMGPPAEKVTITKKALDELKKRAAEGEKHKKEADRLKKELQVSKNKVEDLEKNLEESTKKYDECRKECDDLKEEYDDMADDVRNKALTISALEKATGGSKVSTKPKVAKEDLNQELVNHVTQVAKTTMFRTWKFIEDELEEKEVTEDIIQYLPVDIGMEVEEFVANYSNVVYEAIKTARTDVQSNGKKRAMGT